MERIGWGWVELVGLLFVSITILALEFYSAADDTLMPLVFYFG